MCAVAYNPGFEWRLHLSTVQLLPIDAVEEGVTGHSALAALRSHTAQTQRRVLGQELWKPSGG